jgi:flagellar biosynthesis/type III secretory pathway M-ring protein FliF/YscJ
MRGVLRKITEAVASLGRLAAMVLVFSPALLVVVGVFAILLVFAPALLVVAGCFLQEERR